MNKTNILTVIENAVLFEVHTKFGYTAKDLNQDKLQFVTDKLIKIAEGYKTYTYIDVGAVDRITVKEA